MSEKEIREEIRNESKSTSALALFALFFLLTLVFLDFTFYLPTALNLRPTTLQLFCPSPTTVSGLQLGTFLRFNRSSLGLGGRAGWRSREWRGDLKLGRCCLEFECVRNL